MWVLSETKDVNVFNMITRLFKKCCTCKKDCSWNLIPCICKNSEYLKSIVDDSLIVHDEFSIVTTNVTYVSTNMTNKISTNVASIVSVNFGDKKSNM